jgi:hypothetical protein
MQPLDGTCVNPAGGTGRFSFARLAAVGGPAAPRSLQPRLSPATLTLAPGASATVTVTVNDNVPDITQPGTYTAAAVIGTDTPYAPQTVPVSMTVNPPKTWGKITGTVTGPSGPMAGATIQINGKTANYTLRTDASGHYQLWLDVKDNPLQVICSDNGYTPQTTTVKIKEGATTALNFALQKA